ncbi:MAG: aminodeoxychorismate/anthranilate synthase component II [Pseudomonadota bacterium]
MKLFLIDNYDSFTYNLAQLFSRLGAHIVVRRNDRVRLEEIEAENPNGIIISPGPKTPGDSGICKDVVRRFQNRYPILGVCLGMQTINEVFEGRTVLAPRPVHGERDEIFHTGNGIFKGIPSPFRAARYHSLTIQRVSPEIKVTAWNGEDLIMGLEHISFFIFGVQFHPESFMTEYGEVMARNFLRTIGEI